LREVTNQITFTHNKIHIKFGYASHYSVQNNSSSHLLSQTARNKIYKIKIFRLNSKNENTTWMLKKIFGSEREKVK
jgi:hypothetical protein